MTSAPEGQTAIPEWTVGDRLRKARELSGVDRQTFAAELGMSRNTVAKYETTSEVPKPHILMAWSMRTGVPIEWLRAGTTPPAPVPPAGFEPATIRLEGRGSVIPLRRHERRAADRTLVAERAA